MFRIKDIKENNDDIIFFKIIEKKYVRNYVEDGQIYFGLLADYRTMEESGQENIGDSFEASLSRKVLIYIGNEKTGFEEIHGRNVGNNIRINANQCAFCFYGVGLKRFQEEDQIRYVHEIPESLLKEFCKDKGGIDNCAIIIFDDNLVHKILSVLKSRNLPFMSKRIIYDDYEYIPKYDIHTAEYSLECCFHKRKRYEYQNEIRVAVLNKNNQPIKDFFVDIDENDLQVLELKSGCCFRCEVDIKAKEYRKFCEVSYKIDCFLADKKCI